MGLSPPQVDMLTPWEFLACVDGFGKSNGWKMDQAVQPMSLKRLRELGIE